MGITPVKNLRERHFGVLQGTAWKDAVKLIGPQLTDLKEYTPDGGETLPETQNRALAFMKVDTITLTSDSGMMFHLVAESTSNYSI